MAQIVLRTRAVAEAKVARGIRASVEEDEAITPVDAIVETWEDDVIPTSTVAALYKIVKIPGLTKQELDEALEDITITSMVKAGGDEVEAWRAKDSIDDWKEIKAKTKRLRSFDNLTPQNLLDLESKVTTKMAKVAILESCRNLMTEKTKNKDIVGLTIG